MEANIYIICFGFLVCDNALLPPILLIDTVSTEYRAGSQIGIIF